jgi:hypothetical protein
MQMPNPKRHHSDGRWQSFRIARANPLKASADSAASYFLRMVLRTGPFDGVCDKIGCTGRPRDCIYEMAS